VPTATPGGTFRSDGKASGTFNLGIAGTTSMAIATLNGTTS
jgi:hypothetical protein